MTTHRPLDTQPRLPGNTPEQQHVCLAAEDTVLSPAIRPSPTARRRPSRPQHGPASAEQALAMSGAQVSADGFIHGL